MELFKASLVAIKQEQLVIILKELLHLQYILNFYKKDEKELNTPLKKEDMFSAFSNLKKIQDELFEVYEIIKFLKKYKDKKTKYQNFKFILIYGLITQKISNSLLIIELIYKKIYQIFEEAQNQYIPKPNLGRRFSNNNLLQALKDNFQHIIAMFVPNYDNSLLLSWSYRNYLQIEQEQENLLFINDNKYGNYINLPYWYYELPILLPSITHEAIRIALMLDGSKLKEIKDKFIIKEVNRYISKPKQTTKYLIKEKILDESNKLIEKVLADVVSYCIYKDSYIHSIFHDLFGIDLAKQFKIKTKSQKNDIELALAKFSDIFHLEMRSWKFNKKRDIILIRLYILLNIAKNNKNIESIREFIESIIPLNKSKNGLYQIYKNHPHYYSDYKDHINAYKDIIELFTEVFTKKYYQNNYTLIEVINKLIKQNSIKIDFNTLWDKRLEKLKNNLVLHKIEFRKLLHKESLNNLKKYISELKNKYSENIEEIDTVGRPYTLTFIKLKKAIDCKYSNELCFDKYIQDKFKNYKNSFGIYDLLNLEDTINYQHIDETLKDIIVKIKNFSNDTNSAKFFESKYSLMKFFPTIVGNKENKISNIDLLYNIELDNKLIAKHIQYGSTFLEFAIKEIVNLLLKHLSYFYKVTIYKSLGPNDLVIYIKGVNNEDLLKLNPDLTKLISIKRTFTTILCDKKSKGEIRPLPNKYYIVSYLRLKLSNNESIEDKIINAVKELSIIEQNYIETISIISGVLDIQIIWKKGAKTQVVFKLYDILMKKKIISDFQTKFNRTIDIKGTQ